MSPADRQHGSRSSAQRLLEQVTGVAGLIYSSLPVVAFVPISTAFGLRAAIAAALGVAAAVLVWQLIRRESTRPAISGFFSVGLCVLIAHLMGESKGYFLLGIWTSLLWAAVFAVSVLIRRPMVGYLWGWVSDQDRGWREVPRAVYAFDIATLTWVLVFGSRFLVQHLLYDAGETGWLGLARIAMGWPLTALAAAATYVAVKAAQRLLLAQRTAAATAQSESPRR